MVIKFETILTSNLYYYEKAISSIGNGGNVVAIVPED